MASLHPRRTKDGKRKEWKGKTREGGKDKGRDGDRRKHYHHPPKEEKGKEKGKRNEGKMGT